MYPAAREVPASHVLPCLRCLRRRGGCLQPTFYHACGACDDDQDACNPRFAVPAVPATTTRMPATHVLPCLRCLRRRRGCLQPTFCRACGAGDEDEYACNPCLRCLPRRGGCLQPTFYRACGACREEADACNLHFTVPALPSVQRRMPATRVLPCLLCLRRRGGPCLRCLRSNLRGNQM